MNKGPIEACETWLKRPQSFLPRLLALDLLAIAIYHRDRADNLDTVIRLEVQRGNGLNEDVTGLREQLAVEVRPSLAHTGAKARQTHPRGRRF